MPFLAFLTGAFFVPPPLRFAPPSQRALPKRVRSRLGGLYDARKEATRRKRARRGRVGRSDVAEGPEEVVEGLTEAPKDA